MDVLIIYAHPQTHGHCQAILQEVTKQLDKRAKSCELINLYKIKYDPILHGDEHYTAGNSKISKHNLELQKKIAACKQLIFIYPVWWFSMPAILKGFFDRVLTPGFAFEYVNGVPHGLLKDKKAHVFITSGGPRVYYWMVGNAAKKMITKGILNFCGIKTYVHQLFNCREFDQSKVKKIEKMVGMIRM